MARALAFTQFIIVSLGAFVLHLLVKLDHGTSQAEATGSVSQFLARYALWLFAIPILYAVVATVIESKANEKAVQVLGVILTVALLLLLGFPICQHLF